MSEGRDLDLILLEDVSKFYGEVLGVNRVDLRVGPGITSLVGPNGSGKTTLLNLLTGLLRPSRGRVRVLGTPPTEVEDFFRKVGYCTQIDSFPRGFTGRSFLESFLLLRGWSRRRVSAAAALALSRVGLEDAAERKIAGYSKGMRQRIKLAQAIAHEPEVLLLDEPLNGLDPLARNEVIVLLKELATAGGHILISSHILHEVDMMSDHVVMLDGGYVVAQGQIQAVREEMDEHPLQIFVRCDRPSILASRIFRENHVVEAVLHDDGGGLHLRTTDAESLYLLLNRVVLEEGLTVEAVGPADDDVDAVYRYLIGEERANR